MEKHQLLIGHIRKQQGVIASLYGAVAPIDLDVYENRYVFALKTQQLYTSAEDLLVYIARFFENNIEDRATFHRELLIVMSTDIPGIFPTTKVYLFGSILCQAISPWIPISTSPLKTIPRIASIFTPPCRASCHTLWMWSFWKSATSPAKYAKTDGC